MKGPNGLVRKSVCNIFLFPIHTCIHAMPNSNHMASNTILIFKMNNCVNSLVTSYFQAIQCLLIHILSSSQSI